MKKSRFEMGGIVKEVVTDIEGTDIERVTALLYSKYGYDFRGYALTPFKKRILRFMEIKALTLDVLLNNLANQPLFGEEFLDELTVNTTELFRDPGFWRALKQEVIPVLRDSKTEFRILHTGCSSGEEVLSMAILLSEMGILNDVSIIATDLDNVALHRAKLASYSLTSIESNERNYVLFEGSAKLTDYYTNRHGKAVFHKQLLRNVSFQKFDLATEEVFNKFDLILCRNVMTYFNHPLQNEVLGKLHQSLFNGGFLAIGNKECIGSCDEMKKFISVNQQEKIYQKTRE